MSRTEFLRQIALDCIEIMSVMTGMWILRRVRYRLIFGVWCKHHSWTPWERYGDHRGYIRECEGCHIREIRS